MNSSAILTKFCSHLILFNHYCTVGTHAKIKVPAYVYDAHSIFRVYLYLYGTGNELR